MGEQIWPATENLRGWTIRRTSSLRCVVLLLSLLPSRHLTSFFACLKRSTSIPPKSSSSSPAPTTPTPPPPTSSAASSKPSPVFRWRSTCTPSLHSLFPFGDALTTALHLCFRSQQNILHPLGMLSTSFLLSPPLASRLSLPIAWRVPATHLIQPSIPSDAGFYARYGDLPPASPPIQRGGGGLLSTTRDYTTLLTHLLRLAPDSSLPLPETEKRLLSKDSFAKMFQGSFTSQAAINDLSKHKPGQLGEGSGDQQWSVGGLCLNLKDWEGRRRAGTGYCQFSLASLVLSVSRCAR